MYVLTDLEPGGFLMSLCGLEVGMLCGSKTDDKGSCGWVAGATVRNTARGSGITSSVEQSPF